MEEARHAGPVSCTASPEELGTACGEGPGEQGMFFPNERVYAFISIPEKVIRIQLIHE